MGLNEQIDQGFEIRRTSTTITIPPTNASVSGSIRAFGGAFILTSAAATKDCRIRLYSDSQSIAIDSSRAASNFNINDAVGLIADITLASPSRSLWLNPAVPGTATVDGDIWYNITASVLVDTNVITLSAASLAREGDSQTDRYSVLLSHSSVPTSGNGVSGSLTVPKGFWILSASSTVLSRLRLYATPTSELPSNEPARAFTTLPSASANLIADMQFDSASYAYKLVPTLEGYNWQMGQYSQGTNVVGYILQNTSGGAANITASLHLFRVEE